MRIALKWDSLLLLVFSVTGIYFLAPTLDRREGLFVSTAFALINILSSHVVLNRRYALRCVGYLLISNLTYFILFNDQPWDLLFHHGMFDSSPLPLVVCSIIMTFAGWLLFHNRRQRAWYAIVTLGLQVPVGLFVGSDLFQSVFSGLSRSLHYVGPYSGSWQAWQLEWMLTYYLPVFFLSHFVWEDKE